MAVFSKIISSDVAPSNKFADHEAFTRRVLDNLFAFVGVLGLDGTVITVNRAPLEAGALSKEDVTGKKFWDCFWWNYSEQVQAQLIAACEKARNGEAVRYDVPVRMAGGQCMWIDFQIAPLRDSQGQITHLIPSATDLTARRRAEEGLRESEARFRATFENAAVGIAHVAPNGFWLRVNKRLCEILGFTEDELRTRTFQDITHPDDLDADLAQVRRMLDGEIDSYGMDKRYLRKDGTIVWGRLTVGCVRKEDRSIDYFISVIEDISERKAAETALRESEQRFRALGQASANALYRMNADASIMLEGHGQGFMTDTPIATQSWLATYVPPDAQAAVMEAVRHSIATLTPGDLEHRVYLADGTVGWIRNRAVPILDESGALREWFGSANDITDRKRAEEALQISEARLRLALEATELGTWHWNLAKGSGAAEADARAKALLGLAPDCPVSYEVWANAILPEDRDETEAAVARAIDPGDPDDEYARDYRVRRADGKVLLLSARGRAFYEDDPTAPSRRKVVSMAGTVRDVTELRQADAIRESERRLRHLGDSLPDSAVYQLITFPDGNAKCPYASAGMTTLLGFSPDELLRDGRLLDQAILPEFRPLVREAEERSSRNLCDFKIEVPVLRADGEIRWIRFISRPRHMQGGGVMWEGIATDVTDRKRAETALQDSETNLRLAIEATELGLWRWDEATGTRIWDSRCKELFGVQQSEEVTYEAWASAILQEDRAETEARYKRAVDPSDPHDDYESEYRFKRPDGSVIWISAKGRAFFRPDANAVAGRRLNLVVGTLREITDHKLAEAALRESEERLRLANDAAGISSLTIDIESGTVHYSPELSLGLGHTGSSRGGLERIFQRIHRDDVTSVRDRFNAALRGDDGGPLQIDFRYVRPGGKIIWLSWSGRVEFRDTNGGPRPYRVIGAIMDITERKVREEKIQLLSREVSHRAKNLLSLVQAIANQTAATKPEDFTSRFRERIQSLAASHDLLVKSGWEGTDLEQLVRSQLAHFLDIIGERIRLCGPKLFIKAEAAQAVGMALHELATNASKYGALSVEGGTVDVCWSLEHAKGGDIFSMEWTERKGPPVLRPEAAGFGSQVLTIMAQLSLEAESEMNYDPQGLRWRVRCPVSNIVEVHPREISPDAPVLPRKNR